MCLSGIYSQYWMRHENTSEPKNEWSSCDARASWLLHRSLGGCVGIARDANSRQANGSSVGKGNELSVRVFVCVSSRDRVCCSSCVFVQCTRSMLQRLLLLQHMIWVLILRIFQKLHILRYIILEWFRFKIEERPHRCFRSSPKSLLLWANNTTVCRGVLSLYYSAVVLKLPKPRCPQVSCRARTQIWV